MLESIRDFALREAQRLGESAEARRCHAEHFVALVRAAEPALTRAGQLGIQALLREDDHNLRVALETLREQGPADDALSLAGGLWRYWHAMGRLGEGRDTLRGLLQLPGAGAAARAKALMALGGLAYWQADYAAARAAYEQALDLSSAGGDAAQVGEALFALSTTCTWSGRADEGRRYAERALAAFREQGDRPGIGRVQMAIGFALWMEGDLTGARGLWEQSLAIAREEGDHVEAASKLLALSAMRFQQGERGEPVRIAVRALVELVERHNVSHVVMALDFTGALLSHEDPAAGCRLSGAADALREVLGGGMRPQSCGLVPARDVAAAVLGAAAAEHAFAEGRLLTLDDAVALARAGIGEAAGPEVADWARELVR
jgi:tetratricopeptide (TPR) repeat protein